MYAPVGEWLRGFIQDRHRKATVQIFDASRVSLARLINDNALGAGISAEWVSWDVHVDVVGFAVEPSRTHMAFVECKMSAATQRDLSQLLGYSAIAAPRYSFLLPRVAHRTLCVLYLRPITGSMCCDTVVRKDEFLVLLQLSNGCRTNGQLIGEAPSSAMG